MTRRVRTGSAGLAALLSLAGCEAETEPLRVPEVLLEVPELVDLGWVAPEESVEGTFTVRNGGDASLTLVGAQVEGETGDGLTLSVEARGELSPGAERSVSARLSVAGEVGGEDGLVTVPVRLLIDGLLDNDPRQPVVEVGARIAPSGLVAEPNPVTLGPVPFLQTTSATVAIRNLRSRPVEVFALDHDGLRARYVEEVARGAFGPLPLVGPAGRLEVLGPGESWVVDLSYTAPDSPGEAKEQAEWRVGSCLGDPACEVRVVVQGLPDVEAPRLLLSPSSAVPFGQVPVGEMVERTLTLLNEGERPLEIGEVEYEGSGRFTVSLASAVIPPEGRHTGTVRYIPVVQQTDRGTLRFSTNDPVRGDMVLPVTGTGVVLPPCRFQVSPSQVDFGIVEVRVQEERRVRIINVGDESCLVFDPTLAVLGATPEDTFRLDPEPPPSRVLDPGGSLFLDVAYLPPDRGAHGGEITVRTPGDALTIPVRGRTPGPVGILCSPDQATEREGVVGMRAELTAGETATRYQWTVLSAPPGRPPRFERDPTTGPEMFMTPFELGRYEIRAEIEDAAGVVRNCTILVVARSFGLEAKLTWDGAGDLDLHLHRGAQTPWYGDDDCHFDNPRPVWVSGAGPGQGSNPALDRDDTSGDGPEYIRLAEPELGVPYTLAVSHFERAAGRRARVEVRCGRRITVLDESSPPFSGSDTGACSSNSFWKVARLVFTDLDQCEIERLDQTTSSADACRRY